MIKLTGNVSRKVPIPSQEFSSQSFSAGMEKEISNDAIAEQIKTAIREMFDVLEFAVKAQIVSNGVHLPEEKKPTPVHAEQRTNGGNGGITPNQKRLLEKLVKEKQIFGKERIALLSIKSKSEATKAIEELIANGKGGGKYGK